MVRSLVRLALGVSLSLSLAVACGSEDSKKHVTAEAGGEAGAAGAAPDPNAGGSSSQAGAPTAGGAGGDAPSVIPTGGAGGEAQMTSGGVGGEVMNAGGAGGVGPTTCCQPKACPTATRNDACGYTIDDGCGNTEVYCDCSAGFGCATGICDTCAPDTEPCTDNQYLCGDTFDNCGNPITCPDNCSSQTSGGRCVDGECCGAKFQCDSNDCGMVEDGCGGFLDCTAQQCDGSQCINGVCCIPDPAACTGVTCGYSWDGCQEVLCPGTCSGTDACIEGSCQNSVCKSSGYECGSVANPVIAEGEEGCGDCADGEACIDHQCVTVCH